MSGISNCNAESFATSAVQTRYGLLACICVSLVHAACVDRPYVTCPQTGLVCQSGYECSRDGDFCAQLHGCGNGLVDLDELCDDGNRASGDGCSGDCRSDESCGNGIRDKLEQCDDSNHLAEDGCSPVCLLEDCGNGALDLYETCDDGNNINGDGCSADCLSLEACGNGYIDAFRGEVCDDGNTTPDDGCSAECKDENCGNGSVDVEELCDDGNNDNGDGCSADCRSREICSNRIRDAAEECDDGNLFNGDGCNVVCTREVCGNAILDVNEACDDGNLVSGDGCSADCHSTEICGDGIVDYHIGEQCDDGNRMINDGCSAECRLESCGDGQLGPGEACDDGNLIDNDGCSSDCRSDEDCGNDVLDRALGEVCDDGNRESGDGCSADCRSDERCGNRMLDMAAGEHCDDGDNEGGDGCSADCRSDEKCGNRIVDFPVGEVCDDGNHDGGDGCSANCRSDESCGNAVLDAIAGEICDEGDNTNGDGCSADCRSDETCGNEILDPAVGEICDDGNTEDGDGCSADCRSGEACGNGVLDSVAEELCDDGNNANGDGCSADCRSDETCGNGIVDTVAHETCDDGNQVSGDGCEPTCTLPTTGSTAGVVTLAAGLEHTCALLATGSVRCWGRNDYGQLGYGHTNHIGDGELPSTAGDVDVGGPVVALTAGGHHTCALLATGTVRCWGRNSSGQLGYGHTNHIGDNELPSTAGDVDVGGPVVALTANFHTCALLATGAVRCWGRNVRGELGYGHTDNIGANQVPSAAGDVDVGGVAVALAAGGNHTCALLAIGTMRCWGSGETGETGYGDLSDIGDNEDPSTAGNVAVGGLVVALATGSAHTCALLATGTVRCWGFNSYGQLGYGRFDDIGDDEVPATAGDVEVGGTVAALATGFAHTCALLATGTVRCWGSNSSGRLGYGHTNDIGDTEVPSVAGDVAVGGAVVALATGGYHTCALLATGAVRCWGDNTYGQLGYGHTTRIGDNELPSTAGDVDVGGSVGGALETLDPMSSTPLKLRWPGARTLAWQSPAGWPTVQSFLGL